MEQCRAGRKIYSARVKVVVLCKGNSNLSMDGLNDLQAIAASLDPMLCSDVFVFVTSRDLQLREAQKLKPVATIEEVEGLTLVIPQQQADDAGLQYGGTFRQITLRVHSALNAVGLTALVAGALARHGISANVIAGFYHDHIFVPSSREREAMDVLEKLSSTHQNASAEEL